MQMNNKARAIITNAQNQAVRKNNDIVMPEHVLYALTYVKDFIDLYESFNGDALQLRTFLNQYFVQNQASHDVETVHLSKHFAEMMKHAEESANNRKYKEVTLSDLIRGLIEVPDTFARYALAQTCEDIDEFVDELENLDDSRFSVIPVEQHVHLDQLINAILNPLNSAAQQAARQTKQTQQNQQAQGTPLVKKLNNRTGLTPVIGREDIVERTIEILNRKTKNNPIHVGEPGVGKTAIIDKITTLIDSGNVPARLQNATVYSLNVGDLMAGTQFRGELETRVKKLMEQLAKEENPILYIDEIHNIVNAGNSGGGSLDIANMLKPYLTDDHIKFIGTTTNDEYKKFFAKDKALSRRFQPVFVEEPSISDSIQILNGLKSYYEDFHGITYSDAAIESAVKLSAKYINDRFLPDKAIDLIDEAGSYATIHKVAVVDTGLIEAVLSKTCKIPMETVQASETDRLAKLEDALKSKVYGQDNAIHALVEAIMISRAGLNDDNKPIGAFLAVGPTGVGKTEIAKVLAETMDMPLVRFDMSEYTDETSANKLIGSSAGYVGYEDGGLLTNQLRKTPSCVLLLDEIEKAHSKIFNLLLQAMDNAVMTDNQGNKVDFRNVIMIMTSNAGASKMGHTPVGFGRTAVASEAMDAAVMKTFAPEFRNRLNATLVFNSMNEDMAKKIAKRQLAMFVSKMENVKVSYSKTVIQKLAETAHSEYGGREIKRNIEQKIKPLFVKELLFGKLKNGGECSIVCKGDTFSLKIK
jgi:ATP-dependent Clp protease ATP-binding subunit ClpA